MPALKPATIGQKFLTDCGQNRPLTTMKHRIAVISDTHGLIRDEVREVLKTCEIIFHGGDINTQ